MDPVKIPVASSMIDLTQVFPELGMLAKAIGEENVKFVGNLMERFWHTELEESLQGKCLTLR